MNKKLLVLTLIMALLLPVFPVSALEEPEFADTVYINGNIYTVDEKFSKASAMAIKGQKLIYVGSDIEAKKYVKEGKTKLIDLAGKTVIPGIMEGHMHFLGLGESKLKLDCFMVSKEEILKKVKAEAAKLKAGEWILGRGWNNEYWTDNKWPTKEELDAVAPNNPVSLVRADGHASWVNTKALEVGGITKDTPNPQGGEILKNEKGEVLGILIDTAKTPVDSKIEPYSDERKYEAYLLAQKELLSFGITSQMDAGITNNNIKILKKAYEAGDMKVRSYELISSADTNMQEYFDAGGKVEIGLYDNRYTMRAVKIFSDGSLGARSAWMLEEYNDRKGHVGNGRYTDEELYKIVDYARDKNLQPGTHAIGNAAVRQVLDVYEKVLKEKPLEDHRYRIEHYQIVAAEDIPRTIKMGVIPSMQTTHATSDKNMAVDRIGEENMKSSYAWRTIIDLGGKIINGSDAPVELVNPYHGLYAGITRMDRNGEPIGGWYPEQRMTREETLRSFTAWVAYGQFEEDIKGSLEAGKLADFAVLDRDIMTCIEGDIKDTQVLTTVIGGEVVYEKEVKEYQATFIGKNIIEGTDYKYMNKMVYVPAISLAKAMDTEIIAEDKVKKTVSIKYKDDTYTWINDNGSTGKNNAYIWTSWAPKWIDGKLYIPLKNVSVAIGLKLNYYADSKTFSISF